LAARKAVSLQQVGGPFEGRQVAPEAGLPYVHGVRPRRLHVSALLVGGWTLASGGAAGCLDMVQAPRFESVLALEDSFDPVGPYPIEAWVSGELGITRVVLRVTTDPLGGLYGEIPLERVEGDEVLGRWRGELLGRPAPSEYAYYLVAKDHLEQAALYPEDAPGELLSFRIRVRP